MSLSSPLKWVEKFRYLEVLVTRRTLDFFDRNLQPLLTSLKACCVSWSGLPLNLIGRINLVKMILLPRFNYIFRNCPIWIPLAFFKEIETILISFIWNGASPRVAKTTLYLPPRLGGLALPNFRVYFWAAMLVSVYWWFQGSRANAAICLEAAFLGSLLDLQNIIYRAYQFLPGPTYTTWRVRRAGPESGSGGRPRNASQLLPSCPLLKRFGATRATPLSYHSRPTAMGEIWD